MPFWETSRSLRRFSPIWVCFARARFGPSDPIDVLVVLMDSALRGEPTLQAVDEQLTACAEHMLARFGRSPWPDRATRSCLFAAMDQPTVEVVRMLFLADLAVRPLFTAPGSMANLRDVDESTQVARERCASPS